MVGKGQIPTPFCSMSLFLHEISQPCVEEDQLLSLSQECSVGKGPHTGFHSGDPSGREYEKAKFHGAPPSPRRGLLEVLTWRFTRWGYLFFLICGPDLQLVESHPISIAFHREVTSPEGRHRQKWNKLYLLNHQDQGCFVFCWDGPQWLFSL